MEGLDRQSLAEGRRWTRIAFGVPETGLREDGPQRGLNYDQSHEKILSEAGDGQPYRTVEVEDGCKGGKRK
jgi:hypothetical protein